MFNYYFILFLYVKVFSIMQNTNTDDTALNSLKNFNMFTSFADNLDFI